MDVAVGQVGHGVLLDDRGDVVHGLLGDVAQLTGGDDASGLPVLGRGDLRRQGHDHSGHLGHVVAVGQHGESVDHSDSGTLVEEQLVPLEGADLLVGDLLLQAASGVPCEKDVVPRYERRVPLLGHVSRDADETSELPHPEGELALPSGTALGLSEDLPDRVLVEVGDLPVLPDLLSDEPHDVHAVLVGVGHGALHVHLVSVSAYPGPESGVHALEGIEVPCAHEDEVAGDGLGLDQCAGGALGLAGDGHLLLLHGREQGLLGFHPEHVDLVDVEDALVGLVDGSGLDPVVGRGLESSGLERVVPDISEEGSGMGSGGVHERRHVAGIVTDQELGDDDRLCPALSGGPEEHHDDERAHHCDERDGEVAEHYGGDDTEDDQRHAHVDVHRVALVALSRRSGLLLRNDRLPLACGECPDPGLVEVLGVVVGDDVLEVLLGEVLHHGVRQHRLSRSGLADEHDVPLLIGRLLHDLDGLLLTDDAVRHQLGDLDLLGRDEALLLDPLLHGFSRGSLVLRFCHAISSDIPLFEVVFIVMQ